MLPLPSTRCAPNAPNVAPQVWFASVLLAPQPSANRWPALWHCSAIFSCFSYVHSSAPLVFTSWAGYHSVTSSPVKFLIMEMRAHGGRGAEPQATGTANHFPSDVPRYSTALLTGPYCLTSASTTSFTGVSLSPYWWAAYWSKARMSCPLRACASAACVRIILLPAEAMKSIVTSTLFLAAHSSTRPFSTGLAAGTQRSQMPIVSLPAAVAVWTCTSGRVAPTAPAVTFSARRRVIRWTRVMGCSSLLYALFLPLLF